MKRILSLCAIFLVSFSLNAQQILLQEFFMDSIPFPPTGWTIIDNDNDGHNWQWDSWTTEKYAISESWISGPGPLTPDNFIITPKLDLTGKTGSLNVSYLIGSASTNYYAEHYQLAVSTTDSDPASFTNVIHEETLPSSLGNAWGLRSFDISSFLGQEIYIAWRHYNCTDQYKLMLDSIVVTFTPASGIPGMNGIAFSVNPNPAADYLEVSGEFDNASIGLINMTGQEVAEINMTGTRAVIDVAELPEGIYFVRVLQGGSTNIKKVVIRR